MQKKYISVLLFSILLAACASNPRESFYQDKNTDFSVYKTFSVASLKSKDGAISDEADIAIFSEIQATIVASLQAKGLTEVHENPDINVVYFADVNDVRKLYTVDSPTLIGHYQSMYALYYSQGKIVIDVLEPKTHRLLWRGSLTAELKPKTQINVTTVTKLVADLMDRYPTLLLSR